MNTNPIVSLTFACMFVGAVAAPEVQGAETLAATDAPSSAIQSRATNLTWLVNLQQAQSQAKAEGKYILLFFHGSDWCPSCAEMQRQVFDSPEFTRYARRMLVLVDVDFPKKQLQDGGLQRANLALKAKFNLSPVPDEGFPTLVLLDNTGQTVFQETGYGGGGPAEILPKLQHHAGTGTRADGAGGFENFSVDEFARMAADKQNVILDVRTAAEFAAGHLPGAVNLDVNAADFESKAAALDKNKAYLVHCASGVRSIRACEKLARLDFPRLYNLPGGIRAWINGGKPVEK
jgi:rhodanese-related sulfurtransferase/thioredoxin-related protein